MRFSHKIAKLADPDTLGSAKRQVGRLLCPRRFIFHLTPEKVMASIDRKKFESIRTRYAVENPGQAWPKYLDIDYWMRINLRRVRQLGLDYGPRRDILDLGSGAGYFLYLCKWLGHRPVGLDIDTAPLYPEMARLLELERVVWRIEAFAGLPDLGRKFDLISAFMICFNNHKQPGLWGPREWEFFLNDAARQLKPRGRIFLHLNQEWDGTFLSEELRQFFVERGARIRLDTVCLYRAKL